MYLIATSQALDWTDINLCMMLFLHEIKSFSPDNAAVDRQAELFRSDRKLMKDLSDSFKEMEAILVSGSSGYEEGKLLGKKYQMTAHSDFN